MGLPSFQEHSKSYDHAGHYAVTNEEPEIWSRMLKDRPIERAASIASGGEVLLFSMLTHTEKELFGIDHSNGSLAMCWAKILLLNKIGPTETRRLFTTGTFAEILTAIRKLDGMPAKCQEQLEDRHSTYSGGLSYCPVFQTYDLSALQREWKVVSDKTLNTVIARLDRLHLLHGDLSDLKKAGPFDCLYVSNAMEHVGRLGPPSYQSFAKLLKADGTLLFSRCANTPALPSKGWNDDFPIVRGHRYSTWTYHRVDRKPESK